MSSLLPENTEAEGESPRRNGRRLPILARLGLFGAFTIFVFFPRPDLLIRQVKRWADMESLIQPHLPEIARMNREIDALLPPGATPEEEIKAVESYVLKRIRYVHDWDQWSNTDYWPQASEVCSAGAEDCDGRAVLAVSILRARGYQSAALAGNLNHMWAVAVPQKGAASGDTKGLLSPDAHATLRRTPDGETEISLPGWTMVRELFAGVRRFPAIRICLILGAALLTVHPLRSRLFWPYLTCALCAFVLVLDWAVRKASSGNDAQLTAGLGIFFCTLLAAILTANRGKPVSS